MKEKKYIYQVNYPVYEETLCAIETRTLFSEYIEGKVFFSKIGVMPSVSPYIRKRIEILFESSSFDELLQHVQGDESVVKDFVLKYTKLSDEDPKAQERLEICKAVGSLFKEYPNFKSPQNIFAITFYEGIWYFGLLVKNDPGWKEHNKRPHTYSNSLKSNMAKVLVNIAGRGDMSKRLIDPCCGAGTVLLEACYAGYQISGSDSNYKMSQSAKGNLAHFGYEADIKKCAIEEIKNHYDSAIVDLPYGLYSKTSVEAQERIIINAMRISDRVVVVSSEDISELLERISFNLVDSCKIIKTVNRGFTRYIWVHDL